MKCSYSTLRFFLSINHHYCAQNLLSEEGGDKPPPLVQHMSAPQGKTGNYQINDQLTMTI